MVGGVSEPIRSPLWPRVGAEGQGRVPEPNRTGGCSKRHLGKSPEVLNPLCFHLLPCSYLLHGLAWRGGQCSTLPPSPPFPLQKARMGVLQRPQPQQLLHFSPTLLPQPPKGGGLRQVGWWEAQVGPGRRENPGPSTGVRAQRGPQRAEEVMPVPWDWVCVVGRESFLPL